MECESEIWLILVQEFFCCGHSQTHLNFQARAFGECFFPSNTIILQSVKAKFNNICCKCYSSGLGQALIAKRWLKEHISGKFAHRSRNGNIGVFMEDKHCNPLRVNIVYTQRSTQENEHKYKCDLTYPSLLSK